MAVIAHVDMDAFFASVAIRDNPALQGLPVVVASNVVAAASYDARRFGIHSAQPLTTARRLCRNLVVVPPDIARYREVSNEIFDLCRTTMGDIPLQRMSLDEAFLDLSTIADGTADGAIRVERFRTAVRDRLGLAVSAGVSTSKLMAKMASNAAKPDGLLEIPDTAVLDWLAPQKIEDLYGVGPATYTKLNSLGVYTIRDLRMRTAEDLTGLLGASAGTRLFEAARGIDRTAVVQDRPPKSFSNQRAFPTPLTDLGRMVDTIDEFVVMLRRRVVRSGLLPTSVSVKLRDSKYSSQTTRTQTLQIPTDDPCELSWAGRLALRSAPPALLRSGVTLLGVGLEHLGDPGPSQPTVLPPQLMTPGATNPAFELPETRQTALRCAMWLNIGAHLHHRVLGDGVVTSFQFPEVEVRFGTHTETLLLDSAAHHLRAITTESNPQQDTGMRSFADGAK